MLDVRARLLSAALGFVTLRAAPRHPGAAWVPLPPGLTRQDFDLQLQLAKNVERGLLAVEFVLVWAAAVIINHIRAVGDLVQKKARS